MLSSFSLALDRNIKEGSDRPIPVHTNMQQLMPKIQVDMLQFKEEVRRATAIAIGDELHKAIESWAIEKTPHIQEAWYSAATHASVQFANAIKEWQETVSELKEAKNKLKLQEIYT